MKIPQDMLPGTTHRTNLNGLMKIISYSGAFDVKVEFVDTGYITSARAVNIRSGTVKDLFRPKIYGIGFVGVGDHRTSVNGNDTEAYSRWHKMLRRCYCPKSLKNQPTYKGCTVDPEWHNFQNFANWFELNYKEGTQLDKDIKIKANKVYSKDTCLMVTHQQNSEEAFAKNYKFINPQGIEVGVYNLRKFCRDNGLDDSCMHRVFNGDLNSHKRWTKTDN